MSILEDIKEAVKLVQKIDNLDLYRKLLDLQAEIIELTQQLREKDQKIAELEKAFQLKGKLVLRDSAYYLTDDTGKLIDGPFCTRCFDVDHIKCRLVWLGGSSVQCQKCKIPFRSTNVEFRF